jgi:hypothetical protein
MTLEGRLQNTGVPSLNMSGTLPEHKQNAFGRVMRSGNLQCRPILYTISLRHLECCMFH